jgi:hypothetical protein
MRLSFAFILLLASLGDAQERTDLGRRLDEAGFPAAASLHLLSELQTESPRLEEVDRLVDLQQKLNDSFLIPTFFAKHYKPSWDKLSAKALSHAQYLIATVEQRANHLERARSLLNEVRSTSLVFPRAKYLQGVINADPRLPGGAKLDEAVAAFETVLRIPSFRQEKLQEVKQLSLLALGRIHYGREQYESAKRAYEQVPKFTKYWDEALVENAFTRFRLGDFGGALGSLASLKAPQFRASFQPEAPMLEATIYHFACLFAESKAAFAVFESQYVPIAEQLKGWVEGDDKAPAQYIALLDDSNDTLPDALRTSVATNERVQSVMALMKAMEEEQGRLASKRPSWLDGDRAARLDELLRENRSLLSEIAGRLIKNRLAEAYQTIRRVHSDGDLIRLETTLADKRLLEEGVDQRKLLADQELGRPALPADDSYNYWQVDGEYWMDEIGFYQFTLKQGCPESVRKAPGFSTDAK